MSKDFTYTVPHMESIDTTAKAFGLSSYAVRKLARSQRGAVFTVKIGSRYLINQEKFAAFLNCETVGDDAHNVPPEQPSAGVQPVPVRL
ncbi:hypothetical protein [uncultured Ruminococcus sp.]|uniref:hypothetical protein n=1 Tax=uncultured Ruminococcus sp. TaxID=165186 RepID=UPI0025FA922B|nr:hypothetical protein [uncultured Ruminococcus sp.]